MRIFIIGPGGVGKNTSGKILARKLDYCFVDLDQLFCQQVANISLFINQFGYQEYCYRNSKLFFQLMDQVQDNLVMPLSSGFLVHQGLDDLVDSHAKAIADLGISILLLPSKSLKVSEPIIVSRQLKRGFGLNEVREREKIRQRFSRYLQFGDLKIFSKASPEKIAQKMFLQLSKLLSD